MSEQYLGHYCPSCGRRTVADRSFIITSPERQRREDRPLPPALASFLRMLDEAQIVTAYPWSPATIRNQLFYRLDRDTYLDIPSSREIELRLDALSTVPNGRVNRIPTPPDNIHAKYTIRPPA
jgi:hypothetical protein